jgi:hypothetical protein
MNFARWWYVYLALLVCSSFLLWAVYTAPTPSPDLERNILIRYEQTLTQMMHALEQIPEYKGSIEQEILGLRASGKQLNETIETIFDTLESCKTNVKNIQQQQETFFKILFKELAVITSYEKIHNEPVTCTTAPQPIVNFIVCIRGRELFLDRLLHSIELIARENDDCNINVILSTFVTPDPIKNPKTQMEEWTTRTGITSSVIEITEPFSKALGLKMALDTLSNATLACTIDVDMIVPTDYAIRIRKHTIQKKSAYSPIIYSLNILQPPIIRGDSKINRLQFDGLPTGNLRANGWWRKEGKVIKRDNVQM